MKTNEVMLLRQVSCTNDADSSLAMKAAMMVAMMTIIMLRRGEPPSNRTAASVSGLQCAPIER
jgi:hypothetical protein